MPFENLQSQPSIVHQRSYKYKLFQLLMFMFRSLSHYLLFKSSSYHEFKINLKLQDTSKSQGVFFWVCLNVLWWIFPIEIIDSGMSILVCVKMCHYIYTCSGAGFDADTFLFVSWTPHLIVDTDISVLQAKKSSFLSAYNIYHLPYILLKCWIFPSQLILWC